MGKDSKISSQIGEDMVIGATGHVSGAVVADRRRTEAEEKSDCMIIEATGNVGEVVDSRRSDTVEKTNSVVIEASGNDDTDVDCRKTKAEEKDDCMIVETSGNVGAVVTEDRKSDSEEKAEKRPSGSDSITREAEHRAEKRQPSSDSLKTKAGEKVEEQQSSSKSTPTSNKPARKRITPITINP